MNRNELLRLWLVSTTLHPEVEDVEAVIKFVVNNQLMVPEGKDVSANLAERVRKSKATFLELVAASLPVFPGAAGQA